jgi:hypothetical protein
LKVGLFPQLEYQLCKSRNYSFFKIVISLSIPFFNFELLWNERIYAVLAGTRRICAKENI